MGRINTNMYKYFHKIYIDLKKNLNIVGLQLLLINEIPTILEAFYY